MTHEAGDENVPSKVASAKKSKGAINACPSVGNVTRPTK